MDRIEEYKGRDPHAEEEAAIEKIFNTHEQSSSDILNLSMKLPEVQEAKAIEKVKEGKLFNAEIDKYVTGIVKNIAEVKTKLAKHCKSPFNQNGFL